MTEPLNVEPLGTHHNRVGFSCGEPALDRYLRYQAGQEQRRRVAAVFVLSPADSAAVAGFYTLSMYALVPAELPESFARKLPRYDRLPAALIGRLAVDTRFAGRGLGRRLLMNALERSLRATEQVAAVAVVVEAKHDRAQRWYEQFGFTSFVDNPHRLFLPMDTINQLIGAQAT